MNSKKNYRSVFSASTARASLLKKLRSALSGRVSGKVKIDVQLDLSNNAELEHIKMLTTIRFRPRVELMRKNGVSDEIGKHIYRCHDCEASAHFSKEQRDSVARSLIDEVVAHFIKQHDEFESEMEAGIA